MLALCVPAIVLASVVAWGDGSTSASPKKSEAGAAASSRDYASICARGNAKYLSRDFDGAIELYRKAIELSPHQSLGNYLLGEAELAAGNLAEAEAAWGRAALDTNEKAPALHARILFVTADLKERQKKWDEARAAWQIYLDWVGRFPDSGVFPATAQSRQQVIDTMLKQDKMYEGVRQRIAATQDGGVFSDPSKSPPAAK
jgi:tetratricopeptide (TPR) repeat protein